MFKSTVGKLILTLLLVMALFVAFPAVSGAHSVSVPNSSTHQQQASREPEANLPFLYAAYSVTWAAFFGYIFFISRRQREMKREIEALRRALEEKTSREEAKPEE